MRVVVLIHAAILAVAGPAQPRRPLLIVPPSELATCPGKSALPETLRKRLPSVEVVENGEARDEDLEVSLRSDSAGWRLEVTNAARQTALTRVFSAQENSCEELLDTCALMLDRYLSDVEWRGLALPLVALPTPPQPAPAAAPIGLAASGGPLLLFESSGSSAFGAELELSLQPGPRSRISLLLLGAARAPVEIRVDGQTRGSLQISTAGAIAAYSYCRGERVVACAGPAAGAIALLASAEGSRLYSARPQTILMPHLGALGQLERTFDSGVYLRATLGALFPLGRGEFAVEGTTAPYATPLVNGLAAAQAGWRFR